MMVLLKSTKQVRKTLKRGNEQMEFWERIKHIQETVKAEYAEAKRNTAYTQSDIVTLTMENARNKLSPLQEGDMTEIAIALRKELGL